MCVVNRQEKFAWFPLRASRLHEEPQDSDPLMKAFKNGWVSDGWLFWEPYTLVINIYGDGFRKRVVTDE